jgi:hypothetical protein
MKQVGLFQQFIDDADCPGDQHLSAFRTDDVALRDGLMSRLLTLDRALRLLERGLGPLG